MFKLITIAVLGYVLYRLFLVPRALNEPSSHVDPNQDANLDEDDFVEYEEIE